jgi:hypothetical protein
VVRAKRATTGIRAQQFIDPGRASRSKYQAARHFSATAAAVEKNQRDHYRWSLASLGPPATVRAASGGEFFAHIRSPLRWKSPRRRLLSKTLAFLAEFDAAPFGDFA